MSFGCTMHYLSLFWEEVAKVTEGKLSTRAVTGLCKPFLAFLTDTRDTRLSKRVVVDIFYGLLKQSDLGRQHEEKYEVWKRFGFPSDRISDMELVEEEDQEEDQEEEEDDQEMDQDMEIPKSDNAIPPEQIGLDPRAGNVSVVLHEIPFNAKKIHQLMEKAIYDAGTRSANRRVIKKIMANYEKFVAGQYPLGVQKIILPSTEAAKMPDIDEKVAELDALQEAVLEETRLMRTLNKGEKKRFYSSGMTAREYLVKLGKMKEEVDETNGIVVEDLAPINIKNKNNKRKALESAVLIQNGENKSQTFKKSKQSQEATTANGDTSAELIDNGFEVEEEGDGDQIKMDDTPVKAKKVKNNNSNKKALPSVFVEASEWDQPLEDGETEYFVTPTKQRLKHLNGELDDQPVTSKPSKSERNGAGGVKNSSAKKQKKSLLAVQGNGVATAPDSPKTPIGKLTAAAAAVAGIGGQLNTPNSSGKRVQIVLANNMAQEKSEYFRQLRNSPQIPFDSTKKPVKGLLKPNLMPSPINPYYKKKYGLDRDD